MYSIPISNWRRRLVTPPSECRWIAVLVHKMNLLTLWPWPLTFEPKNSITSRVSQDDSLYQVWTLWDQSFLSYAADKQTNRRTRKILHTPTDIIGVARVGNNVNNNVEKYVQCHNSTAIIRVHPIHLMNVDHCQAAAILQTLRPSQLTWTVSSPVSCYRCACDSPPTVLTVCVEIWHDKSSVLIIIIIIILLLLLLLLLLSSTFTIAVWVRCIFIGHSSNNNSNIQRSVCHMRR